jgi:hypothetical protein
MIKTDWKAKLKTTLAAKEKTSIGSKTTLTKGDKTQEIGISSVFVSVESSNSSQNNENVFDGEHKTGTEVVQKIFKIMEERRMRGLSFINFDQPTWDAYKSEIALVGDICRRDDKQISEHQLDQTLDRFIEMHLPEANLNGENWVKGSVMLYYVRFLLNGNEVAAYTCNTIQAQIAAAYWLRIEPETIVTAVWL